MAMNLSLPYGTKVIKPEIVVEQPVEGAQMYTILTPNTEFSGVVLKRQFINGRTFTWNENLARQYVTDFHYAVEPALPPVVKAKPKPGTKKRARIDSATFTEGALG